MQGGVLVERLLTEAFASPPDLVPGDVVLQVGASRISTPEEFAEAWDSQEPGSRVRFLLARGSRRIVRRAELPGRDCRPDGATPRELDKTETHRLMLEWRNQMMHASCRSRGNWMVDHMAATA